MRSVAAALLLGVLMVSGCTADRDMGGSGTSNQNRYVAGSGTSEVFEPAERRKAPKAAGTLLDGGSYHLASMRGQVVVVNYWGSWCAPCRLEAPELMKVARATKSDGVAFLGVNIRDDKDKAVAFEERFGVTYPSLFDPAGRVALQFREVPPTATPATIVIDRKGRIAAVFREPVLVEDLQPVVRRIAKER